MPLHQLAPRIRGPWSLEQSAASLRSWPPVRRFGDDGSSSTELTVGFLLDGDFTPVAGRVEQAGDRAQLSVAVPPGVDPAPAFAQLERIFSLDVDASDYPSVADRDPTLAPLLEEFAGLRPVLFPSPYEAAVWAVLAARISMNAAAALQQRLIDAYGIDAGEGGLTARTLPPPETLRHLEPLPGLTAVKIDRLRALADAADAGLVDLEPLARLDAAEACARLQQLPGVGPFWALLIYVRACGVPDHFADEPLTLAALGRLHDLGDHPGADTVAELSARYAPFRTWVSYLLRVAAARGAIPGITGRTMELRRSAGRSAGRGRRPPLPES